MERIAAYYLIETPYPVEDAAAVLAGEQSSGTFVAVPGETAELKTRFAARVEQIELLEEVSEPALPGDTPANTTFKRARVKVSWPLDNVGYNIPALISTIQGNLYELRQFTGLKLDDIELPATFTDRFRGPAFGLEGTMQLAGVTAGRPMIGTIIKPSVGLTPEYTAQLVKTLAEAGIDFVKDDELMTSTANSPFAARVEKIMRVINNFADRTGKRVMYAFNITGDLETMEANYDTVVKAGGTCAMVSINSVGWSGVKRLCDRGALSIHGHRNGWGMLNRHPLLGINFPAYNKIWRLAGVDQMHVNGIKNKFWESDDSVVRSIRSCHTPFIGNESVLPVVSSGQWGGQAFETYKRTKTTDLLYMAGGGIIAHPLGPEGGVRALRQAWESAVAGLTLEEAAAKHLEFGRSVEKFG
ncbi:ribulose-bisphosphate carboxylase large subunit family protein [Flavilitoribacter nigricans]|uniref:Ribulose 1,5-bisphosphate carboxylase n=1 Tax=Flavilitoribacter nigricans (strain ATCC 23147 / DSM 23189 / NBRC 102662 / NCIMB 1420 / SS-2) TaxID=1122177 RepID=A0A2D0N1P9_FLAN2|nr:ribulose-bisphosphate carboxylase large subunit family protein [Flavilitoribacter nigricans]PHN02425.1 ribulose 1,5-bisphosphate carboxylase [Flavilitoribacter nigricans DSM 23189 = NBRC 102662]